jgi:kinesin family protein 18/19
LFRHIEKDNEREYEITVQYIEIYNESINDLIDSNNKNLEIRESISSGIYINRLSDNKVFSVGEVMNFMQKGDELRNTAATK